MEMGDASSRMPAINVSSLYYEVETVLKCKMISTIAIKTMLKNAYTSTPRPEFPANLPRSIVNAPVRSSRIPKRRIRAARVSSPLTKQILPIDLAMMKDSPRVQPEKEVQWEIPKSWAKLSLPAKKDPPLEPLIFVSPTPPKERFSTHKDPVCFSFFSEQIARPQEIAPSGFGGISRPLVYRDIPKSFECWNYRLNGEPVRQAEEPAFVYRTPRSVPSKDSVTAPTVLDVQAILENVAKLPIVSLPVFDFPTTATSDFSFMSELAFIKALPVSECVAFEFNLVAESSDTLAVTGGFNWGAVETTAKKEMPKMPATPAVTGEFNWGAVETTAKKVMPKMPATPAVTGGFNWGAVETTAKKEIPSVPDAKKLTEQITPPQLEIQLPRMSARLREKNASPKVH
jgi:hypothetical protein